MPTRRERIIEELERGQYSVRELAVSLQMGARDVRDDLEHVRRSVGGRFRIKPAECMACGFVFRGRDRLNQPSRCPECRQEQIIGPFFWIEPHEA